MNAADTTREPSRSDGASINAVDAQRRSTRPSTQKLAYGRLGPWERKATHDDFVARPNERPRNHTALDEGTVGATKIFDGDLVAFPP
jgi:hypothetical protein